MRTLKVGGTAVARWGAFASVGMLLVVALLPASEAGAAVLPCVGSPASRLVGANTTLQTSIFGGRAQISSQDPNLCGSTSVSVAWSMVTAHVAGQSDSHLGWAQVGFGRFGNDVGSTHGFHMFAQFENNCDVLDPFSCSPVTKFDVAPPSNAFYSDMFKDADNRIHMYATSGNQLAKTGFDPTAIWDAAWQDQFQGETKHLQTDAPGTTGDRVQFTTIQKLINGTGDWQDTTNLYQQGDPPPCRYHFHDLPGTSTDFEIYTDPLNSTSC